MLWLIGTLMAVLGLMDLFNEASKRTLPWWGDVIVIGAGVVIVVIGRITYHLGYGDEDDED